MQALSFQASIVTEGNKSATEKYYEAFYNLDRLQTETTNAHKNSGVNKYNC